MEDQVKQTVQNIVYPFYISGNDFKELSLKAKDIKEWIIKNGQELKEFIFRHRNHYAINNYEDIHLKNIPSAMTKVDIVFKEPLEKIKYFKDDLNKIRNNIIALEKVLESHKIDIKNNMTQARFAKQQKLIAEEKLKQQKLIEEANNLNEDMGLDIDQIQDEQVRVMEKVAEIDKSLEPKELKKVGINLIKEKLLIKDIEILGIDDDFLQNANKYELINLIKNYLTIDEKIVKNTIKSQWDTNTNTDTKLIGIKGINIQIKGVK